MTELPETAEHLAEALASLAARGRTIWLGGASSKTPLPADGGISTRGLSSVRRYEPRDLTISVDAGMPWAELERTLAANRQMIPLDPPWTAGATVGGVVATNFSGPRRRGFGTARDHVIGMTFATVDGKLAQCGGMVVKNVAGLDLAKLLIGSWGTLAAIASVNFKLTPAPEASATFRQAFASAVDASAARDRLLRGVLTPAAADLLNPAASREVGLASAWNLLVQAQGPESAMRRWRAAMPGFEEMADAKAVRLWTAIREFPATHSGVAARRFLPADLAAAVSACPGPAVARAASGILYAADVTAPNPSPPDDPESLNLMRRIKAMFDPDGRLNPGRLAAIA